MTAPSAPARIGPPVLGPMDDKHTAPLLRADAEELHRNLKADAGQFAIIVDVDSLIGLIRPFNTRARHILVSLLRGYSVGMAATAAGVDSETVRNWGKRHPAFAESVERAREWGFRRVFESELQRRALAGPEDRGSMRALELIVKRSDPEYREKSQLAIEVVQRAQQAGDRLVAGWSRDDDSTPYQESSNEH